MELYHYMSILRPHWRLVVAVPLLVALLSLAVAATGPPRYGVTATLLVTRSNPGDRRLASPINLDTEDRVAYDLPAIVGSSGFARDVVAELARRGRPLSQALVEPALHAESDRHLVYLSVATANPGDAVAIAEAAAALIKTNGLRYWGDQSATPNDPGINVAVLELPSQAALLNGPRAIALEVALRALVGLIAGVGAAFAMHYLGYRPSTNDQRLFEMQNAK
jgi:capsular polysaccharide biosynthesis protein